jgi:surfactin synthase thioesterase subunit
MPLPSHFIASGSRAPHLRCEKECIYELPQNEFIQEIEKLKGTPKEIISSPELMKLFEPLLRADFKMADNYQAKATKIHCPISVLHGKDDSEITSEQLEAWSELSDANFEIIHLPGDHFFINTHASMVIRHVNEIVLSTLKLLTAPIPKTIIL